MVWTVAGLLIRSALVLLFAELLLMLAPSKEPAYRHKVLLTAFFALLLWPLFRLLLPEFYIPLTFAHAGRGLVSVNETLRVRSGWGATSKQVWLTWMIWIMGFLCGVLFLAAGHLRTAILRRRARPLDEESDRELISRAVSASSLRRQPQLLIYPRKIMPQTFGIIRPCVLLPDEWSSWNLARKEAVLLHEFAHIGRHDVASQLVVNLAITLWWFQPLCWLLRRRVRTEGEQACDLEVLRAGMQPSAYAAELLAIANTFQMRPSLATQALLMADSGSLPQRLQRILDRRDYRILKGPTIAAVIAMLFWAASCSAVSVAIEGHFISKGGVSMRRTLFATMSTGLLASASLSAAAIGGSVLDPSGAAISDAKASLYNPDSKTRQEVASSAGGKFEFDNLSAGQYILRVDKPGFAPILRAFAVQQNAVIDRGITLQSGAASHEAATTGDSVPGGPGPHPIRIGGQVAQSNLVEKIQPIYPSAAKAAGIQGTVRLEAVISAEGSPEDIQVISSPDEDLSQSALEAVRQWRYRPVLLNGSPVEVVAEVVVNYTLAP